MYLDYFHIQLVLYLVMDLRKVNSKIIYIYIYKMILQVFVVTYNTKFLNG